MRSPKGERAEEEIKRLVAKGSLMRVEIIIWACTCFSCSVLVHLSARNERRRGFGGGGGMVDKVLSSHIGEWVVLVQCSRKDSIFGGNI